MPKKNIDYSNTIIYKITCKNTEITDIYVGHTTNFVQRKHAHKQSCINSKTKNHNCKLYQVIRENGGWENWKMEIIHFFNCIDHYDARKKEQEYFIELSATLNSIEPFPTNKAQKKNNEGIKVKPVFFCNICNLYCDSSKTFDTHIKTNKHQKNVNIAPNINSDEKKTKKFACSNCSISCAKKSEWMIHIKTKKHIKNELCEGNKVFYSCKCGKNYKDRSGLWRHEKICSNQPDNCIIQPTDMTPYQTVFSNLVGEIIKNNTNIQKQNQEFQKQMLELYKNK